MRLALGPVAYLWPAAVLQCFYARVADWPVDVVYLGEVICAKRRELSLDGWLELAEGLRAAGKEVVLSSLALIEAASEAGALERLARNQRFPVEANDMAAVHLLEGGGFVVGPHVNVYNAETLHLLRECGATRWVPPVELSRHTLASLQSARPDGLETELFAFGRLPLAFSARCFTARAHNVGKDQCELRCGDYPDGLPVDTQEGARLFAINGIQLQSASPCNLIGELEAIRDIGVDLLRISPVSEGTGDVVRTFRDAVDGMLDATEASGVLARQLGPAWSNGYWHGEPGMSPGTADA
jgi:collagenase-like PrtC family protease